MAEPGRRRRRTAEMGDKPRKKRRPPPPEKRRRKKPSSPMLDLHITVLHDDYLIRISQADWQKMISHWILAEETVILRGPYKGQETDIILRGATGARVGIRGASDNPLPRFQCILAVEVMMENLAKQGL